MPIKPIDKVGNNDIMIPLFLKYGDLIETAFMLWRF